MSFDESGHSLGTVFTSSTFNDAAGFSMCLPSADILSKLSLSFGLVLKKAVSFGTVVEKNKSTDFTVFGTEMTDLPSRRDIFFPLEPDNSSWG